MAFGWDDVIIAAIGAGSSAYAANSAANSITGSNQQNEDLFHAANQFTAQQAQFSRDFNASEAAIARQHSAMMANTSYQRATKDMMAAGLNPMLAVSQGGAATPSPNQASASGGSSVGPPTMRAAAKEGFELGLRTATAAASMRNMDADTELKRAQTHVATNTASKVEKETEQVIADTVRLQQEAKRIQADDILKRTMTENELVRNTVLRIEAKLKNTEEALKSGQLDLVRAEKILVDAKTVLTKLAMPAAANAANAQDHWWMREVAPFLDSIFRGTGAVQNISNSVR